MQDMQARLKRMSDGQLLTGIRTRNAVLLLGLIFVLLPAMLQHGVQADSSSQPESAPAGDLEMLVRAGFGEVTVVGIGVWVPFRIVLRNNGEPVSGKLIVSAPAPRNQQSREFVKEINMPAHSIQLHEITAFLTSTQEDPVVRLLSNSGSGNN